MQTLYCSHILGPGPYYTGEIWKRSFRSKNSSSFSVHTTPEELENGIFTLPKNSLNVFRPNYSGGISQHNNHRSFWICVWRKLTKGNHVITVNYRFRKAPFPNVFRVHGVFQIPLVSTAFPESSVFMTTRTRTTTELYCFFNNFREF